MRNYLSFKEARKITRKLKLNSYYGGSKTLKRIQKHDDIKNTWCAENNYKLIRISYKEKGSIYEILKSELFS